MGLVNSIVLRLPREYRSVRAKAGFELSPRQEVDPYHLLDSKVHLSRSSSDTI